MRPDPGRARRRKLSMTSLIDVIFLLLLFFMLTSTFSKFAEVELSAAGPGRAAAPGAPPVFVQLSASTLRVNGRSLALATLQGSQLAQQDSDAPVLVSLEADVTAQRLTDLLVALRQFPGLRVTVLAG